MSHLEIIANHLIPIVHSQLENVEYSIKAFSISQWEATAEEVRRHIFSKHTVYVYGGSQQKLLPNVSNFTALSLARWFDLSAKRCVHGKCFNIGLMHFLKGR